MINFAKRNLWTILVARTHHPLASKATVARTWWSRIKGLLGRRALDANEALIIPRCRSIHTVGMRFPIDAVFVDRDFRVVALRGGLSPWRVVPTVWKAWGVVELAEGTLVRTHLKVGDQLCVIADEPTSMSRDVQVSRRPGRPEKAEEGSRRHRGLQRQSTH
jgi:uncharacterized membrane protein (UPF0127 family)